MAYTNQNFKTKKALKEAVASGERIGIYSVGYGTCVSDGREFIEGPHYPAPHTWYAEVTMRDGSIVKVK